MLVREIMSHDIVSLNSDDSIERAAQLMKQYDIGSIPVCSNNQVVGIVTDRDITLRSVASGQGTQQKVGDIMSSDPAVGKPDMNVQDAAKIMSDRQIRRLPIVENNSIVGMVSLGDISVEPSEQKCAENALKNISKDAGLQS
jgi:CBS domain-containing protein